MIELPPRPEGPIRAPLSLMCPPARAKRAKPGTVHGCIGVAWVGEYPDDLQDCTCPCHQYGPVEQPDPAA